MELLSSNSDKALVFSQWVTYLNLIELSLKDAGIQFVRLDGRMLRSQRERAINDFNNNPNIKVFLISLKCGSMGLNLVVANRCFLMDPWWNPSIEDQAIDRIYRISQTRPVSVFRLVIENSIEDRVIELQDKKCELISRAFGSNKPKRLESEIIKDLQNLLL